MLFVFIITILISITICLFLGARKKYLEKRLYKRVKKIELLVPAVEAALSNMSILYRFSHYITESERIEIVERYSDLYKEVTKIISVKKVDEIAQIDTLRRFYKAMSNTVEYKKKNNEHFIENQLSSCAQYFDTILSYPLDSQQREAIVSLEDNVLVISSAGSGKTMTIVGKVRYLIDVQHVNPEKILLITFTRKAAESLSERLGEKDLKCRTFHKLALEIIGETTGEKPSITNPDFPLQVYHDLTQNNVTYRRAIMDYILRTRYKMKDQFEYSSMQEYMQDRQKYGIQAYFNDMDGHPVFCKSDEESQICDFLGSRGIKFRYEEKYEIKTVDSEYRQYHPDFSIYYESPTGQSHRVYLEHFAINENNRCPLFFSYEEERKYKEGIIWKRSVHKKNGTILIETSSADFHRGNVFEKLTKQLTEIGIVLDSNINQNIARELTKQEESILNMLSAFNFLMKSRNLNIESILQKALNGNERFIINEIIAPFVKNYQRMEEEKNEIDFTDSIIRASEICNRGYRPEYDYILVDEFQDISLDRYHFLQSLRRNRPLTKLFCVGDDWQSIYRFAGSDMALFRQFSDFFGYTKKCYMETTYRFGEPAIERSSKFILTNPGQEIKKVHPFHSESETLLDFLSTENWDNMVETVKYLVNQIPDDKEILLLGRYSFDVNIFKDTDFTIKSTPDGICVLYGNRKMSFMTVHQSKGLESDYIIILNCNGGKLGFPADISDSPILNYVLSEPENYAYGEERRVFYVGITRAKKHTWVLYDINNPSRFVKEFTKIETPETKPIDNIPESERCPKCHCGRTRVIKKGIAVNGNPYSVLVCSNEKYGCDYRETVFKNLNFSRRNTQMALPRNSKARH